MTAEQQRAYKERHPDRVREADRRYRQTPKGIAAAARRRANYRANHPDIKRAHWALTRAVYRGKIRKQPCVVCGDPRSQGHHHNGYERAHWLDVTWLCDTHHKKVHR